MGMVCVHCITHLNGEVASNTCYLCPVLVSSVILLRYPVSTICTTVKLDRSIFDRKKYLIDVLYRYNNISQRINIHTFFNIIGID